MKMKFRLTFWGGVAALTVILGLVLTVLRFSQGLGKVTALTDAYPWGLWIGFDVVCGVGLAAGGFTIAAIVYLFGFEKYHPIVRPAILTAFLGYLLVIFGLMYDLGRPWSIWHAIIMWNPRSVMFEVAWCVMLYTTVLALEFSPLLMERFKLKKALRIYKALVIPLVALGVILSTLHQSSLGTLFLIFPEKLHPFWYSPLLPVFFFISAVFVGLAMVIVESFLSFRAFGKQIEFHLLDDLAKYMVAVILFYTAFKVVDFRNRHVFHLLTEPGMEKWMLFLEIGIGILIPVVLLSVRRWRKDPRILFAGAGMVVAGFVLNRLNTTITGFERYHGFSYFPSWMEICITLFVVTLGVLGYRLAVKYLPVFEH